MKVLLFGDGLQLKEKGKVLREQNGWTVHLRSIKRWAGDVELTDAAYFLEPADAIRAAYKGRGIDCFLVEAIAEAEEDADLSDDTSPQTGAPAEGEAGGAGEGTAAVGEGGGGAEEAAAAGETSPDKTAEAKARRQAGRKGK